MTGLIEMLIEMIVDAENEFYRENPCGTDSARCEMVAEHLLANGVVLPPVKEGQTVYQTEGIRVYESVVRNVIYDTDGIAFDETAIGHSVFLTREDAEAAIRKRMEVQKE
jgi:hypothetical protein